MKESNLRTVKKVLSCKFYEDVQLWVVIVEIEESSWTKHLFFDFKEEAELIKQGSKV